MSTSQLSFLGERRISKRRKIKTEKVVDEYMILNPFKKNCRSNIIPDQLNKQLRKLEYLSNANLEKIKLRKSTQEQNQNLSRMRKASFQQEEKYLSYLKECPTLQTSCSLNILSSVSLKPVIKKPVKSYITSITQFDIQNFEQENNSKIQDECRQNLENQNMQSNLFSDNYDYRNQFPELRHDFHVDQMQNDRQNGECNIGHNQEPHSSYEMQILQQDFFNLKGQDNEIDVKHIYVDYASRKEHLQVFSCQQTMKINF